MEGFGVLRAANLAGVPALEIRVISNHPADTDRRLWHALLLSRSGNLDYWHGEGSADPPSPRSVEREPGQTPSLPVINALTVPVADRDRASEGPGPRTALPGESLAGLGLAATVAELGPGIGSTPYHYVHGREE